VTPAEAAMIEIGATAAAMVKAEKLVVLVGRTCRPSTCPAVPPSPAVLSRLAVYVSRLLGDGR
jgi:hypothetical protein